MKRQKDDKRGKRGMGMGYLRAAAAAKMIERKNFNGILRNSIIKVFLFN